MGSVVAVLIFIVGVYIALRVSGLTRLAVTLLGGTGLVGLALGFAFRDIAEKRPSQYPDLIKSSISRG